MSQNEKRPCVPDSTQGHFISWFCYWVLPHNTIVLRQTLLFSKGQFLLFSLFFSFFPNISHLTLHFPSLFLQFSLRTPHHRVKLYENLRSAIWKLRGSFFPPLFRVISTFKGIKRKEWVNKDKM